MNISLTPQAWLALGCLFGVVGLTALVLWNAWRSGRRPAARSRSEPGLSSLSFTRSWEQEDARLTELARQVEGLKKPSPPPPSL